MTDSKRQLLDAAAYENVTAALGALDAIEQLQKDEMIGSYDAAVIDKEMANPTSSSAWIARGSASSPKHLVRARCPAKNSTRRLSSSPPARED